jgi:hypothetical protein
MPIVSRCGKCCIPALVGGQMEPGCGMAPVHPNYESLCKEGDAQDDCSRWHGGSHRAATGICPGSVGVRRIRSGLLRDLSSRIIDAAVQVGGGHVRWLEIGEGRRIRLRASLAGLPARSPSRHRHRAQAQAQAGTGRASGVRQQGRPLAAYLTLRAKKKHEAPAHAILTNGAGSKPPLRFPPPAWLNHSSASPAISVHSLPPSGRLLLQQHSFSDTFALVDVVLYIHSFEQPPSFCETASASASASPCLFHGTNKTIARSLVDSTNFPLFRPS